MKSMNSLGGLLDIANRILLPNIIISLKDICKESFDKIRCL